MHSRPCLFGHVWVDWPYHFYTAITATGGSVTACHSQQELAVVEIVSLAALTEATFLQGLILAMNVHTR